VPLPGRPTSTSGIFKSPVAPAVSAQAARATTIPGTSPKSTLPPQRQWTSADQITVRLPTSEPAVLQRIIGQPVTVVPAGVQRLHAEEMLAEGASVDEPRADEMEFNPNAGRVSTSQRYLILVCLVAAVILPLCWAGLGAIRPQQDKVAATQAPQAAPQQSAAAATPSARDSQEEAVAVESPPGAMQPGDAAIPAGGAAADNQTGMSGSQAATPAGQVQTRSGAVGTDAAGSPGPVGINLRIPGRANSTGGARVSGAAALGGAHAPGGAGTAAAAGTSASAARAADAARRTASSDTPNMSADSGSSAGAAGLHEEFPEIPAQIRKSIRGHVKVSVRVIIDEGGSVFAALVDNPGPSHYFDKVAIEAAKKWTFPPAESSTRWKLVRFDFTRDGTTGQAVEVQ
jgi:TonB family protein